MKILLTGANGQVGQALRRALVGHDLVALGRDALDLSDPAQIGGQVRRHRPTLIINAAAYTAVDVAETDVANARAINAVAPGLLAEQAAALGIPLIHYSTDYVFDGRKPAPYTEEDPPAPLGVYGRSKLAGEQAALAAGADVLVLRTSWVYSGVGRNFLLTMQRLLQERDELRVVDDQIGAPTSARAIAEATGQLIERWRSGRPGPWGLYHLTAAGETSWFGFAEAIASTVRARGLPCARLVPIPSRDYPTPAARPSNSRLDCRRLAAAWGVALPDWRVLLTDCLAEPPSAV